MSLLFSDRRLVSFFFNDTATTEIYTLSLHDALPICLPGVAPRRHRDAEPPAAAVPEAGEEGGRGLLLRRDVVGRHQLDRRPDRKSTRLNSSHANISYAVFCLKKKQTQLATSYDTSQT